MINDCLLAETNKLIIELIHKEKEFAGLLAQAVDYCHLKVLSDHILMIKQKLHINFPEQLHSILFQATVKVAEEVPAVS